MKTKATLTKVSRTVARNQISEAVVTGVQATAGSTAAATKAVGQAVGQATVDRTRWFVGFSRDGLVAAGQRVSTPASRSGVTQLASLLLGSTMIGLGVALFVRADLGVPAYDVMLTAISGQLGITLGQAGWFFTGCLFVLAMVLGQRPRPTAILYIVGNGLAVDTFMQLIREPENIIVRIGFVVLGTLIIIGAVALVVHTGLGGGATELLMRAGEARGMNPFRVRTALEMSIVVFGVALGGSFGPATIFFVLTVSPILRAGQLALDDHRSGRRLRISNTPST